MNSQYSQENHMFDALNAKIYLACQMDLQIFLLSTYQKNVCRILKNLNIWSEYLKVKSWSEESSHSKPLVAICSNQSIPLGDKDQITRDKVTFHATTALSKWKTHKLSDKEVLVITNN